MALRSAQSVTATPSAYHTSPPETCPLLAVAGLGVQIRILQSPLERGKREQNGDWLSFPPTAGFPTSAATAEKIACPRFAADRIPICSPGLDGSPGSLGGAAVSSIDLVARRFVP
jgi:hypothetical protein